MINQALGDQGIMASSTWQLDSHGHVEARLRHEYILVLEHKHIDALDRADDNLSATVVLLHSWKNATEIPAIIVRLLLALLA